jgi:RNA polymerase sigma-70 factor (ECF subfamily)
MTDMREKTDEALLDSAGGDEAAFMMLFERHREVIFRVAYRLTNSTAAAEDITQECFFGLLNSSGRFDPTKGALRTYLYGAVRNQARKYHGLREGKIDIDETEIDEAPEPSQVFLAQEKSQMIQQAISTLPLQQREALILFQYEELSIEEIADILGIDIGAVKSRLHRARARLRRILTPTLKEVPRDDTVRRRSQLSAEGMAGAPVSGFSGGPLAKRLARPDPGPNGALVPVCAGSLDSLGFRVSAGCRDVWGGRRYDSSGDGRGFPAIACGTFGRQVSDHCGLRGDRVQSRRLICHS